jgi:cyclase
VHRFIIIGFFLSAFVLGAISPAAPQPAVSQLIKEKLADGVYLFRAPESLDRWTATNVVVVINDADVTVFDSNTRPSTTRLVIGEIRALTDKPVRTLINSHWHMDHWSGNDEFVKAFPGIQIIATARTRDYMKRMGSGFLIESSRQRLARTRAALDEAKKSGKLSDGAPFTAAARRAMEEDIAQTAGFVDEMAPLPRVLPNLAFEDRLTFWRGTREFRLFSATGDATGSTVLYLPAEKIVVTGDVLVSPPSGSGPPPWTTNSFAISPWVASLKEIEALDLTMIVPGQGPAMRDKSYLSRTIRLFSSIIGQVHASLERGVFRPDEVIATVNVDAIGLEYTPGETQTSDAFKRWVASVTRKVIQESLDGILPSD